MRLHRLDTTTAVRLSQRVLDRPAAGVAARELARSTIAYVQAAQGQLNRSGTAIAQVHSAAAVGAPTCRTCSWHWNWPGAPGSCSPVTWPGSTRSSPTSSPTSPVPATSGSAPATWPSSRRTRPGCVGRATRPCGPRLGACAVLATSRVYAGLAQAERAQSAALRGDVGAGHRGDGRSGPHPCAGHGGALPVAGAGPGRGARRIGRPAGRGQAPRRPGRPACDRMVSPGTRCTSCTTWCGWTRRACRSVPPAPTVAAAPSRSASPSCPNGSTGRFRRCWPGTPARR